MGNAACRHGVQAADDSGRMGVRSYVLQALALALVAIVGGVELWHNGTLVSGRAPTASPLSSRGDASLVAPVSFKAAIAPIFRAHCAECHLDGNNSGGLHLDSYGGLIQGGTLVPGSIVQAGAHERSILWQIVQPTGEWPGGNRMPLDGGYLSSNQISTIARWIDQGARDN